MQITLSQSVVLTGPNIVYADDATWRTFTGFTKISIDVGGGRHLVFDVDTPPIPEEGTLTFPCNLRVSKGATGASNNSPPWDIELPKNTDAILTWRWPNPLSPKGDGILLSLKLGWKGDKFGWLASALAYRAPSAALRDWTIVSDPFNWGTKVQPITSLASSLNRATVANTSSASPPALPMVLQQLKTSDWFFDSFIDGGPTSHLDFSLSIVLDDDFPAIQLRGAPKGNSALPANARIFGLLGEDQEPEKLEQKKPFDLRCVSTQGGYYFELRGIAGDYLAGQLSLPLLWNAITGHYGRGLATTRPSRCVSFFPTLVQLKTVSSPPVENSYILMRFCGVLIPGGLRIRPLLIGAQQDTPIAARLSFSCGYARSIDNQALVFDMPASALIPTFSLSATQSNAPWAQIDYGDPFVSSADAPSSHAIQALISSAKASLDIGLGSATVRLQEVIGATLSVFTVPNRNSDLPSIISFRIAYAFNGLNPKPLSSDELAVDSRVIIVDSNVSDVQSQTFISEQTGTCVPSFDGGMRSLSAKVRTPGLPPAGLKYDVFSLQLVPFGLVRSMASAIPGEEQILASYTDSPEASATWQFAASYGYWSIWFPPQAIGEEMIKGETQINGTPRPFIDRPFDTRLSPPAALVIDSTPIATARTIAPWDVAQAMDIRLGTVGSRIESARFELLYGLTANISTTTGSVDPSDEPPLYLATLKALVGSPRLPTSLTLPFLPKGIVQYTESLKTQIVSLSRFPAQWRTFRQWADRRPVDIENIQYELRRTRQTADPFNLLSYAGADVVPGGAGTEPLRGGVDFGFESKAVYDEFVAANDGIGSIHGLTFGAIGGSGEQHALFSQGKTQILTTTNQGRLSNLTIIRIGRIARVWNKARHVIVYERSTRTAPRYKQGVAESPERQPDDFEGLAALRKVREYVEITEPNRTFPDHISHNNRSNGPFLASCFDTTVIPIKPSWARDISDGYVVPLRGPLTDAEDPFYPFPKILQRFARAHGKGDGTEDHLIEDPSELAFFSSTRSGDGSDSDQWAPVAGVDYSILGRPTSPPLDNQSTWHQLAQLPSASQFEAGDRTVSNRLVPPPQASNLLHNRPGDGIEGRIYSVTLSRGQPSEQSPEPTSRQQDVINIARIQGAQIADGFHHLQALLDIGRQRANSLDESPDLRVAVQTKAANLVKLSKSLKDQFSATNPAIGAASDWLTMQRNAIQAAQAALIREQDQIWTAVLRSIKEKVTHLLDSVLSDSDKLSQARQSLSDAVGQLSALGTTRLASVPNILDQIGAAARTTADNLALNVSQRLCEAKTKLRAEITQAQIVSQSRPADAILSSKTSLSNMAVAMRVSRQELAARLHQTIDPLFGAASVDSVQPVFFSFESALLAPLTILANDLDELSFNLAFDPDLGSLLESLDFVFPKVDGAISIKAQIQFATEQFSIVVATATWAYEDWFDLQLADSQDTFSESCEALLTKVAGWSLQDITGNLAAFGETLLVDARVFQAHAAGFIDSATSALAQSSAWQRAQGIFDRASSGSDTLNALAVQLANAVSDGSASLQDLFSDAQPLISFAVDALQGAQEHALQSIVDALGPATIVVEGLAENALQTTRLLADGPISDLISCNREKLGYYLDDAKDYLDTTPAAAVVNDLGDSLNGLSMAMPFKQMRDRLIPDIGDISIKSLLPDFGGLKLGLLLDELSVPQETSDFPYPWLKVTHGFDPQRQRAFASVDMNRKFHGESVLVDLSPVQLRISEPTFLAHSALEVDARGERRQETTGSLNANWNLYVADQLLATISNGNLFYDGSGHLDFDFKPENIQLAPTLQFLTEAMASLMPSGSGLTVTPLLPAGISVSMSLPLPDVTTGACTLTGLSLNFHFDLSVADGFEVQTGIWLSRPDRPFGLAITFLGGGGWIGVDMGYKPPVFSTHASFGISAGAFAAINLGDIARGSAGLLFTAAIDYRRSFGAGDEGAVAFSVGILIWGEFDVLSIASASLRIVLRITYDGHSMLGYGSVSVSIRICWCYTLDVNRSFQKQLAGSSQSSSMKFMTQSSEFLASTPVLARVAIITSSGIESALDNYFALLA